jgi:hypothetical protein
MKSDTGYPELAAYLLSVLMRNDRTIRTIGPPRPEIVVDAADPPFLTIAIGRETIEEGGEAELWVLLRGAVALLPSRREEALFRLVRPWAPLEGWLDDQDIPAPPRPVKHRVPDVERIAG